MKHCGLRIADCGLATAMAVAVVAGAVVAGGGCAKRQSTMSAPPQVNPPPPVEASPEARVDELGNLSGQMEATVRRLPGGSPEEHRQVVQESFARLAQVLPILYGPNPDGTFRQHLRVVENARAQLAAAPRGLSAAPTVDTGLRAAHDSLRALAGRSYFDQGQVGQTLDRLTATIARLDTARGAAHDGVVSDVLTVTSEAVSQMSQALAERLAEAPASKPATRNPPGPDRATP